MLCHFVACFVVNVHVVSIACTILMHFSSITCSVNNCKFFFCPLSQIIFIF